MRKLFLTAMLVGSMSLMAQEVTTYQQLDNELVKVVKYNGEQIIEVGYVKKVGDKLKNTGTWKQYDNEGNIKLKVKYENGLRTETIAYQDNRVIHVYRKEK